MILCLFNIFSHYSDNLYHYCDIFLIETMTVTSIINYECDTINHYISAILSTLNSFTKIKYLS